MECTFKVGDRVVCIDDRASNATPREGVRVARDLDGLAAGQVYTIREIYLDPIWGLVGVRLEEIHRGDSWDFLSGVDPYEAGYAPERFRPVIERGTDLGMSILRNLLNKTGKPVEVDA